MENLEFETEMITLKDLLKVTQIIPSGGLAKAIIKDEGVILNGEECFIPGKKLYKGDTVIFDDISITII
ncbi:MULTISPECIES: RNA-binding S4 domain-containing protein [Anaerococcus]|jgi:S4 domain-containing protein|uniref:RNA-binding S4 domain-containing protein n=1 Tax=Anaerococcus nagyae TaxID=1755241 RepID=A0A3E2TLJ4_9FIRM|nr:MULTISPECIES: RNA-binding S4 domain-containing protein [Anaerococcus]MBP2070055.1 ribosome-associated protein [Anaerococcus nagyae]MDU1828040.1 RNA-binding S4 domain-containing protein [Anaerococcus sp.]MDU1864537.1 RNA-binding S4 domain-containing protein [Anaerococcus sp.]MDU2353445.1 RNA-binding S4 domain-containing protein [Anaerococcus sp.]MDU2565055.1 RNA-binding S4 domain-containing protein [Anaerococcus sp.]